MNSWSKVIQLVLVIFIVLQGIALGFLSLVVYQATPNSVLARQTVIGRIPGVLSIIRLSDRAFNSFYKGQKPPKSIPHYNLEISKNNFKKIEKYIPTQLPSNWYGNLFLTDDSKLWVKGEFEAEGKKYSVKVRVRGDLFNHWAYRKKSWRIKFPKDNLFNGMREINLIIPEDRGWTAEPFNVYRAHKMGLLYPATRFVTVSLNGSKPLLYTEMEHWGKEMLEKQGRPGDVNLYKTGGGTSEYQQWDAVFTDLAYWSKYEKSAFTPYDSYEEIDLLLKLSEPNAHKDPMYRTKLKSVIDIDRLVAWYGISLLSGSRHVRDHNLRLFFDSALGRFEPIPWDISLYGPISLFSVPGNPFLNEVMRDPILRLKVHRFVWDYVQDKKQVQDDLDYIQYLRELIEEIAYRDPLKLPSNRTIKHDLDSKQILLKRNFANLKNELNKSEILINQIIPMENGKVFAILDITTRGPVSSVLSEIHLPLKLKELVENKTIQLWRDTGDNLFSKDDIRIKLEVRKELNKKGKMVVVTKDEEASLIWPGEAKIDQNENIIAAPHTRHRFFLVSNDKDIVFPYDTFPIKLDIRNAVTGKKSKIIGDALVDKRTFKHLNDVFISPDEFIKRNPVFKLNGKNEIILSGNVLINSDTIIPLTVSKFIVNQGAEIRMGSGVSIISYVPVQINGSESSPVIFSRYDKNNSWGVFAVLNADEKSSIKWSEFYGGSNEFINGAYISGMVAFYNSKVSISDSIFSFASGDDGLNIKYIPADIKNSLFKNNQFDGLDIDFAPTGSVENSSFINNGNDGLDISWSPINIKNITVKNSGDKCISVGERSNPSIYNSILEECAIGLAVKDDSHAEVKNVTFKNNKIGISAYVKKPIFKIPSAVIKKSEFIGNKKDIDTKNGAKILIKN